MPMLHIALHDGFAGQRVRITLNGRTIYDQPDVRTDLRIARADAIDVDVPARSSRLSVTIDPGGVTSATDVDAAATPYLAITIEAGGGLSWKASAEPFRYL